MKKRLIKFVALLLSVGLAALLCEGLFSAYALWKYRTVSLEKLDQLDTGNSYVTDANRAPTTYTESLLPHPYLAHVYKTGNNVGLRSVDYPVVKDKSKFTILVTGGSVAAQIVERGAIDRAFARYDCGKPVVVLGAGGGGWHQPQQFIALGLYGDVADAVVTLDGFNEGGWSRGRLENASGAFLAINPILEHGYDRLGASWQCGKLREFGLSQHSRAVYFATKTIRDKLAASGAAKDDGGKTLESIFMLPSDWPMEQCFQFNMGQYRKYIRLMHGMSGTLGIKDAYFIQPVPRLGKTLTEEELRVIGKTTDPEFYARVADSLLVLRDEQVPVVPLLDCFENTPEAVYVDAVHCNAEGYRIMAERIAGECARLWGLPEKQPQVEKSSSERQGALQ